MLGRAIFEDTKRDIQDLANTHTNQIRNELQALTSIHKAIATTNRIANQYSTTYTQLAFKRLREIGNNAVEHYAPGLTELEREQEVGLALDFLVHNKYYGLTLPERLRQSHLQLRSNIRRSGQVGAKIDTRFENIARVFNYPYPFGAHKSWDTRLFLAEAVRLEHVIAVNMAHRRALKLVRWTISGQHNSVDYCDHLASAVDPKVTQFIDKHRLDTRAEGVYFLDTIPNIPHPNCQCTLRYINEKRRKPKKRLNLIQRIVKAIFR